MGSSISYCPQALQTLASMAGLGGGGSVHPSGIHIKGIEYSTVKLVGEGGYAFVYEAINNATGETVALKRYVFSDEAQQRGTEEEIRIYRLISNHEHIVAFIDSEVIYRPRAPYPELFTVMEYCVGPNLQSYINNRITMAQSFSVREVYEIVDNVVRAIGHLHAQSPPVSHWDIKPDNFIFTESGALKLCDFGSATQLFYLPRTADEIAVAESELMAKMTLLYRPPESCDLWLKKRVDFKADIWALGVLVYVLVFKEMPFEASVLDIVDGVPKRYREGTADTTPAEFAPLMAVVRRVMLVKDPDARGDIFTVSEELSKINRLAPLDRPRAGLQSSQRPRF